MSKCLTQFPWLRCFTRHCLQIFTCVTNSAVWRQILKRNDDQHLILTHTTDLDWLHFICDNPSKLMKQTQFSYNGRLQEFVLTSLWRLADLFQHLFCHNWVKDPTHDCTRCWAVWLCKPVTCASTSLCSCYVPHAAAGGCMVSRTKLHGTHRFLWLF